MIVAPTVLVYCNKSSLKRTGNWRFIACLVVFLSSWCILGTVKETWTKNRHLTLKSNRNFARKVRKEHDITSFFNSLHCLIVHCDVGEMLRLSGDAPGLLEITTHCYPGVFSPQLSLPTLIKGSMQNTIPPEFRGLEQCVTSQTHYNIPFQLFHNTFFFFLLL